MASEEILRLEITMPKRKDAEARAAAGAATAVAAIAATATSAQRGIMSRNKSAAAEPGSSKAPVATSKGNPPRRPRPSLSARHDVEAARDSDCSDYDENGTTWGRV